MATSDILNEEEKKHLDSISWDDLEDELELNKQQLRESAETNAAGPEFDSLSELNLDYIRDLPLKLVVEVGRKRFRIGDLLKHKVGSIIELDNKIGTPLNILINDKVVGKGVIVVHSERFCIKIIQLIDDKEKLSSLKVIL